MKSIVIFGVLVSSVAFGQLKNAGFEDWSNITTHQYEQEMINTHNVPNPEQGAADHWAPDYPVGMTRTTDAYQGNYAMAIHNWYTYIPTLAVYRDTLSQYPTSFRGYYKYLTSEGAGLSFGNIKVKGENGDTIIDQDFQFADETTWSDFTVYTGPVDLTIAQLNPADSIIISFYNGPQASCGNGLNVCRILMLDGLWLSYTDVIGVEELAPKEKKVVAIYDLLGRKTTFKSNTVLIYQYSDGTSEKVFVVE
ncbi:MAG: hypothetical protein ACO2Z9_10440 [Crocinitomicaceae bacterium]